MAVYTHVSEKNLEVFLELYNVGKLKWVKGIAEGVENSNYILATDQGQFILTLYEARVNENDLPFFLGLMNHLAEAGLNTAKPIEQNNGALFSELCGKKAALIEFLDGVALKKTSEQNLFQLGVETANFHQKADGFELRRKNSVGLEAWKQIFKDSGDVDHVAPEIEGGLAKLMQDELDYLTANMPTDLPKGVVHADLFPDNVFFIDGNLSGIIDFYFACEDLFAYELAIIINAWCFDEDGINLGKIKALFRGYQSVRKLSDDEMNAMPVLCRASSMRFLVTRLYDWINVPKDALVLPKRPDEYIEKLQFHQKIQHQSEYGL